MPDVVRIVRVAGDIAMRYYVLDDIGLEHKSDNSPITLADKEIDAFLKQELLALCPDFGWLSEETVDDKVRLQKEAVWVVDPIDGTAEFVNKNAEFAISVALCVDGKPVLGVVFAPAKNDIIYGGVGLGVQRNDELTHLPNLPKKNCDVELLTSRSETKKGLWQPFDGVFKQRVVGSCAYKMALLAAGDGYAMATLQPKHLWDMAAGHALCLAAGLRVTDMQEQDIFYHQEIVTIDRGLISPFDFYDSFKQEIFSRLG